MSRPSPGVTTPRALAVVALLVALAGSEPVFAEAAIVRRPGSGYLSDIATSLENELRRRGQPPKLVELTGDPIADAAKVSRECGSSTTIYAIGIDAANTVAQSGAGAGMIALGIPNPARASGNGTYISAYPRPQAIFQFAAGKLNARKIGMIFSPGQNREVARTFAEAAAASGATLLEIPVASSGELVRSLKEHLGTLDALVLAIDPILFDRQSLRLIVERSAANKVPLLGFLPELPRLGVTIVMVNDPAAVASEAVSQSPSRTQRIQIEVDSSRIVVSRRSAELIGLKPESLGANRIE